MRRFLGSLLAGVMLPLTLTAPAYAYGETHAQVKVPTYSARKLLTKCPDGSNRRYTWQGARDDNVCRMLGTGTMIWIAGGCELTIGYFGRQRWIRSNYYGPGYWLKTEALSRWWVNTATVHCR
jgi:hypothetical protein